MASITFVIDSELHPDVSFEGEVLAVEDDGIYVDGDLIAEPEGDGYVLTGRAGQYFGQRVRIAD